MSSSSVRRTPSRRRARRSVAGHLQVLAGHVTDQDRRLFRLLADHRVLAALAHGPR